MCGLAGVSGNLYSKDCDAFRDLLYMTALRGDDSTGIAVVNSSFDTRVFKAVMGSYDFVQTRGYDRLVNASDKVIMGHCRKATQGKINAENAHPFEFKTLVGCHNGTLTFQSKNHLPESERFDTDSETIFNAFEKVGPEKSLENMKGAWALVWYDKKSRRLNFLRNAERPLFYVFHKNHDRLYWASEITMLHAALHRNGVEYSNVYTLPENIMYSWEVPKGQAQFKEPDREKLEGRKEDFFLPQTNYHGTPNDNTKSGGTTKSSSKDPTVTEVVQTGVGEPPWNWNPNKEVGYWCSKRNKFINFDIAIIEWVAKQKRQAERIGHQHKLALAGPQDRKSDGFTHRSTCACPRCLAKRPIAHAESCLCIECLEKRYPDVQKVNPSHDEVNKQAAELVRNMKSPVGEVITIAERIQRNRKKKYERHTPKNKHHITYQDENGRTLSKRDFDKITSNGCGWCGDDINWQDPCIFYGGQAFCIDHADNHETSDLLKQGRICK